MRKKIFGILMTLSLLLSLCLVTATQVTAAVILYVDDSNTSGSEDGSQANPYNTITEAITAASAGDTIIVAGGTYAENVTVDKRLIIRAKSGETATVSPASGDGFSITADRVTIDGFAITAANGIIINSVSSCTITNNTITNCTSRSIDLSFANTNVILGNTCSGNTGSYNIEVSNSNGNIITNNACTGNTSGTGMYVVEANGNTFAGNTCSAFAYGIFIQDAIDNIFTANTCYMNNLDGTYLAASTADDLFSRNTFIYNTLAGNDRGMRIANTNISSSLVYFKNNNITNNDAVGVQNDGTGILDATANYWSGNTLDQNGNVDTSSSLASAVTNTIPVASVVTTSTTTSTTTSITTAVETETTTATTSLTTTKTDTDTVVRTQTSISTVPEGTVTLLNPTTLTETQSVTSTGTEIRTTTQSATVTDTQSATITVVLPQTFTATTTLNVAQETMNWPVTIFISVGALLAGGLIVTIIIRKG